VRHLARDATKVTELQEEVTRARATIIMAGTRVAQAERMDQERVVLLVTTPGEVSEAAQRVSTLEGDLVATRWARDAAKEKILSMAKKTVVAERRRVAVEE
jgi:type IV secretory pathway TrbL component